MSSTFFTLTVFLLLFCQVLCFYVVVPQVLWIWKSFFYPQGFFTLHTFPTFATVLQVLQIWERFFYPQTFFTLNSFWTFGAMGCFTNLLSRDPWSKQFFLEVAGLSNRGLKHRPGPSVCLNHTVFSKIFFLVGSIYVLQPYRTLYQNLPGFEPTL